MKNINKFKRYFRKTGRKCASLPQERREDIIGYLIKAMHVAHRRFMRNRDDGVLVREFNIGTMEALEASKQAKG